MRRAPGDAGVAEESDRHAVWRQLDLHIADTEAEHATVHPAFGPYKAQMPLLFDVAETLARAGNAPHNKFKRLADFCNFLNPEIKPERPHSPQTQIALRSYAASLKTNVRGNCAILAVTHYLTLTSGLHGETVLPDLLRIIDALPYLQEKAPVYGDEFAFALLTGLMDVAEACPVLRPVIYDALLKYPKLVNGDVPSWLSYMRAMCVAQKLPFSAMQELQSVLPQVLRFAETPLRKEVAVTEEKGKEKRDKKDKKNKKREEEPKIAVNSQPQADEEEEEEKVDPQLMFSKLFACEVLRRAIRLPYVSKDAKFVAQIFELAALSAKNDQFLETDMKGMQLAIACCLAEPSLEGRCVTLLLDALGTALLTPNEHVPGVFSVALDGLVAVAKCTNDSARVVEALKTFYLDEFVTEVKQSGFSRVMNRVQRVLVHGIARILQHEKEQHGLAAVKYIIHQLTNQVFTAHTEFLRAHQSGLSVEPLSRFLVCIVSLLAQIATSLNEPEASDILVPMLIRCTCELLPLDEQFMKRLTDIALLQHSESHARISELFTNVYRRMPQNVPINAILPEELARLSKGTTNAELAEALWLRLVRLFQQLATQLLRSKEKEVNQNALQTLALLLPAIAYVMPPIRVFQANATLHKSLRTLWYYAVRFQLVVRSPGNAKSEDWLLALGRIAALSPPLLIMESNKVVNFAAIEMEITSAIEHLSTVEADTVAARRALTDLLTSISSSPMSAKIVPPLKLVSQLTYAQCQYVICLHWLEGLRASNLDAEVGFFRNLFGYLEDEGIKKGGPVLPLVAYVITDAVARFLQRMQETALDSARERLLVRETQYLLLSYCHRDKAGEVRAASDRYLIAIMAQFPQILWSKDSITALLDAFEVIAKSCDDSLFFKDCDGTLPHSAEQLLLPEDISDRRELLHNVTRLARVWLINAASRAPTETANVLHEYMQSFKSLGRGFMKHIGFSMAVSVSSSVHSSSDQAPPNNGSSWDVHLDPDNTSAFVNRLEMKTFYLGQVAAMLLDAEASDSKVQAIVRLGDRLAQRLRAAVAGKFELKAFTQAMCQAVAFLISQPTINEQLLHLVCWSPVMTFTEDSMEAGIWIVGWLLAARADLETAVLTKLADAWCYTVDKRHGLFSGTPRKPSPLSMLSQPPLDPDVGKANAVPHRIWLKFLIERFEVAKCRGSARQIYSRILFRSIAEPDRLSVLPSALLPRYLLLLFTFRVIHGGHLNSHTLDHLLLDKVFSAAFSWFGNPPIWYDPGSRAQVAEMVRILVEFGKLVQAEPARAASDGMHTSPTISALPETGPFTRFRRPKIRTQTRSTVLLLFLDNEIERISTWHNPLQQPRLAFAEERLFSEVFGSIAAKQWPDIANYAWSVAPRLAIQLVSLNLFLRGVARYPNAPKLGQELELLIRAQPWLVMHDSAAVPLLATPAAAASDLVQLRCLLTWRTGAPSTALTLLEKANKSHPYLTKYAIRTLSSFEPETVVYYIPQLIQVLRWDTTGQLEAYFLRVASRSQMLAHQLIWNASTYTADGESQSLFATTDLGLREAATQLRRKLVEQFTERQAKAWQEESGFFLKITNISGELRPLSKEGPARREHLKQALHKIQLSGGRVYLPSTPGTTVLGINYDGAAPMQSAAKSPILVPFLVEMKAALHEDSDLEIAPPAGPAAKPKSKEAKEETKEKERDGKANGHMTNSNSNGAMMESIDDGSESSVTSDTEPAPIVAVPPPIAKPAAEIPRRWQACIFKVGDDVRQDMLALQIIDLNKRIFQDVGLNLYLFPYRVVATAPGCGIIEVVPNTQSRDQLGKKTSGSLYDYFQDKYGPTHSVAFQRARKNFIKSIAAYSLLQFLLAIKDRHNGNVLVDDEGHLIHIDFGFILDIAPGGITFERAPFKASEEISLLLERRSDGEPFRWFVEKVVQAYLAVREHMDTAFTLVSLMSETDLPCFAGKPSPLPNLKARFSQYKTVRESAAFMAQEIRSSFQGIGLFSSGMYDVFQAYTQGISYAK